MAAATRYPRRIRASWKARFRTVAEIRSGLGPGVAIQAARKRRVDRPVTPGTHPAISDVSHVRGQYS